MLNLFIIILTLLLPFHGHEWNMPNKTQRNFVYKDILIHLYIHFTHFWTEYSLLGRFKLKCANNLLNNYELRMALSHQKCKRFFINYKSQCSKRISNIFESICWHPINEVFLNYAPSELDFNMYELHVLTSLCYTQTGAIKYMGQLITF